MAQWPNGRLEYCNETIVLCCFVERAKLGINVFKHFCEMLSLVRSVIHLSEAGENFERVRSFAIIFYFVCRELWSFRKACNVTHLGWNASWWVNMELNSRDLSISMPSSRRCSASRVNSKIIWVHFGGPNQLNKFSDCGLWAGATTQFPLSEIVCSHKYFSGLVVSCLSPRARDGIISTLAKLMSNWIQIVNLKAARDSCHV